MPHRSNRECVEILRTIHPVNPSQDEALKTAMALLERGSILPETLVAKTTGFPEWRSASEDPPDAKGRYIVCADYGSIGAFVEMRDFLAEGNWHIGEYLPVLYWMPLPKPPALAPSQQAKS